MIPSEMAAPMPVPSSWMDPGSSTSGRRLSYPMVFALLLCQGARTTTYLCDDGVKWHHSHDKSFAMTLQLSYASVPPSKALQWHLRHACKGHIFKNNQPVQWRRQPMPQQVICGTCCSAKSCNQPLRRQHRSTMQQVICGLVVAMPPQASNATYVIPLKISICVCSNKKPACAVPPASCTGCRILWRRLAGVRGMHHAKKYIKTINQCNDGSIHAATSQSWHLLRRCHSIEHCHFCHIWTTASIHAATCHLWHLLRRCHSHWAPPPLSLSFHWLLHIRSNKKNKYGCLAPPVRCSGGISWRRLASILTGFSGCFPICGSFRWDCSWFVCCMLHWPGYICRCWWYYCCSSVSSVCKSKRKE